MKNYIIIIVGFILLTISACGPSQEEIARIQSAITSANSELTTLSSQLINANAKLEAATDKMERIKEWQLLRTQSEREQQIADQSTTIQNLEAEIQTLQLSISSKEGEIAQLTEDLNK